MFFYYCCCTLNFGPILIFFTPKCKARLDVPPLILKMKYCSKKATSRQVITVDLICPGYEVWRHTRGTTILWFVTCSICGQAHFTAIAAATSTTSTPLILHLLHLIVSFTHPNTCQPSLQANLVSPAYQYTLGKDPHFRSFQLKIY